MREFGRNDLLSVDVVTLLLTLRVHDSVGNEDSEEDESDSEFSPRNSFESLVDVRVGREVSTERKLVVEETSA